MACSFLTMVRPHYPHIIYDWCIYHTHTHTSVCKCCLSLLFQTLCCITHTFSLLFLVIWGGGCLVVCECAFVLFCTSEVSVHPLLVLQKSKSWFSHNRNTYKRGYCVAYNSGSFQIFTWHFCLFLLHAGFIWISLCAKRGLHAISNISAVYSTRPWYLKAVSPETYSIQERECEFHTSTNCWTQHHVQIKS